MAAGWRSSTHGSTSFAATWVRSVLRRPPTCRPGPGSRRATSGRPSPRSTTRARWSASGTRPGASCWTFRTRHDPGKTRPPLRGSCRCGTRSCSDSAIARGSSRTRIGRRVISRNGDVLPTFLVDGRVRGFWWAEPDGAGTRVVLEPFRRLAAADRRALEAEADRLARFVGPLEPAVYARYRTSGARRH